MQALKEERSFLMEKWQVVEELELDFTPRFRGWYPSLREYLPIDFLELPHVVEKALVAKGIYGTGELLRALESESSTVQWLTREQRKSILNELEERLVPLAEKQERRLPLYFLCHHLFRPLDLQKRMALLLHYGLQESSPKECHRLPCLRPMRESKRQGLVDEGRRLLAQSSYRQEAKVMIEEMATSLLTPWIDRRGGIATMGEIGQRLLEITIPTHLFYTFTTMLQNLFSIDTSIWFHSLEEIGEEVYSSQPRVSFLYRKVHEILSRLFDRSIRLYPLQQLMSQLGEELMREDEIVESNLFFRIIAVSPLYRYQRESREEFIGRRF